MSKRIHVKQLMRTYYDIQKVRISASNRVDALNRYSAELRKEYGEDDPRPDAIDKIAERMRLVVLNMLKTAEENTEKELANVVSKEPIIQWLEKVKGIGPKLTASLVGTIEDIRNYPTVSTLWANAGLDVKPVCGECHKLCFDAKGKARFLNRQVQRRWEINLLAKEPVKDEEVFKRKQYKESEGKLCQCEDPVIEWKAPRKEFYSGLLLDHNPFLRMTCWKISGQFVKQGQFYRTIYEQYKEFYKQRDSGVVRDIVIENRARRATVKLFLSHLWEMWRKAEGLPAGKIYLQEKLGDQFDVNHTYIDPPYKGEYFEALVEVAAE